MKIALCSIHKSLGLMVKAKNVHCQLAGHMQINKNSYLDPVHRCDRMQAVN